MNNNITPARKCLREHADKLISQRHVIATGVGYKMVAGARTDTPSIICSVEKKLPTTLLSTDDLVPATLNGIPTDVIEIGKIRALQVPTDRFRPTPGGISIGHKDITTGTLGCWVRRNGQWMILSNNHVLANSNDATIGDAILQPGPTDGGKNPQDQIATLENFVPIQFTGRPSDSQTASRVTALLNSIARLIGSNSRLQAVQAHVGDNLVDAAIARPLQEEDVLPEILNIGSIQGMTTAELGMAIKKMGRTTGFTEGQIQQVDVSVNVQYGGGRIGRFTDQLMAGPMSQGGDSGSAVLDDQNRLLGLLFAGSEQTTIINRIQHVFDALDLSL
jgi:hypothetical protein